MRLLGSSWCAFSGVFEADGRELWCGDSEPRVIAEVSVYPSAWHDDDVRL